MNITLRVWRQPSADASGRMVSYSVPDVSEDMSFLEMLDVLNERLTLSGDDPIAFDHDCREGICGTCSLMIDGQAHGPQKGTATCQLHMRKFADGAEIVIEPWRATAFPVIKDLMVDRSAFDTIVAAGGFITAETGGAPARRLPGEAFPVHAPIPGDDVIAAVRWTRSMARLLGIDPGRVALGGASAGGNLAAAVSLRLAEEGESPAASLLMYPVTHPLNPEPTAAWNSGDSVTARRT